MPHRTAEGHAPHGAAAHWSRAHRIDAAYHPTPSGRITGKFDLRATRDLSSRRIWREGLRNVLRTATLLAGDALAGSLAIGAVFALSQPANVSWAGFIPRILLLVHLSQAASGTYRAGRANTNFGKVLRGAAISAAALFGLDAIYGVMSLPPQAHLEIAIATAVALCGWRAALTWAIRRSYEAGYGRKRTLIVAEQEQAWDALERIRAADEPRIQVLGHLVPDPQQDPTALGGVKELARFIEELDVSDVVISAHLGREEFQHVVDTCFLHGTMVSVVPTTLAEIPCRVSSRDLLGWPLLELAPPGLHLAQLGMKRAADIACAVTLLVLLSPVFLLLAIAIRLDSPGPVFFRQRRPGLAGRQFGMLKFRSMRADAEEVLRRDPALYAKYLENDCKLPAAEDPRISRLGRFIRATSLDELPQLINVLMGDMSLIGPRPVVGPELEHYGPARQVVLAVRPGMTGYWQVAGRSSVVYPERANMDLYYVTHWSIGLDLKILARTIPAVIRRHGAH